MADRAWAKYLDSSPDLVLLADDAALALLARRFAEMGLQLVLKGRFQFVFSDRSHKNSFRRTHAQSAR